MHWMQPVYQAASSTDDNISMFRGTLKSDGLQPFVTSYFVYGCDCQSQAHLQQHISEQTLFVFRCLYMTESVFADWIYSDVNISEQTWQLDLSTAHTVPAVPFRGILLSFWSEIVVDMICHTPLHRSGLSNTLSLILIFIFYFNHPSFFFLYCTFYTTSFPPCSSSCFSSLWEDKWYNWIKGEMFHWH